MYENWGANATVVAATLVAVGLCVLVHYEGLLLASRRLAQMGGHRRVKVLYAIGAVLFMHITEIWVFGMTYWLLLAWPASGHIAGQVQAPFLDMIYLSAITYTTVGYGDVAPVGPIRFLAGTEALTGLVLVTWSASFTFLEMQRFWRE